MGSVSAPPPARPEITKFAWVKKLGHAIINNIELEIGGSRIDKHYGDWFNIWAELTLPVGQDRGYAQMIGDVPALTTLQGPSPIPAAGGLIKRQFILFVPLYFFFNRNNGLALPLIALQYHEVRMNFEFTVFPQVIVFSGDFNPRTNRTQFEDCTLLVDYVYLDSEERRRFAQVGHEYLIEQLQFTGSEAINTNSGKFELHFNHPSKELIWVMLLGLYNNGYHFMAYTDADTWEGARNDMAAKLIEGQYLTEDDTGFLVTNLTVPPDVIPAGYVPVPAINVILNATTDLPAGTNTIYQWNFPTLPYVTFRLPNGTFIDYATLVAGGLTYIPDAVVANRGRIEAVITRNDLTIANLSRPVERLLTQGGVDNRTPYVKAQDVVVYIPSNYGLFIDGTGNPTVSGLIKLNGHDRFDIREGRYFNYVQPYQHHTNTPADGVNLYSFALKPEDHQPSGTCNFSRIDTAQLNLFFDETVNGYKLFDFKADFLDDQTILNIYCTNYNVLRIMSGMGCYPLMARKVTRFWYVSIQKTIRLVSHNCKTVKTVTSRFYTCNIIKLFGEALKLSVLNCCRKMTMAQRRKLGYSKKLIDWVSTQPSPSSTKVEMDAVQRLNGNGSCIIIQGLRYSLVSTGNLGVKTTWHIHRPAVLPATAAAAASPDAVPAKPGTDRAFGQAGNRGDSPRAEPGNLIQLQL